MRIPRHLTKRLRHQSTSLPLSSTLLLCACVVQRLPPCDLMVARTEGGPAREVAGAGKRAHVHTDLRDDDLRGALIDPGNAIATWVTACAASQSRSTTRSPVVVRKVCTCCCVRWPGPPPIRTQAAAMFLCTSSAQQRSTCRSIVGLLHETWPSTGGASWSRFCSAC